MNYFPLYLRLEGARILVVGGGEQAAQKVRLLRKTKAHITVVADETTPELNDLAESGAIEVLRRPFVAEDVAHRQLVFAAAADRELNAVVSDASRARGVPVNVVDDANLGTVIMPAIVDRDPVTVAIGTEGTSPVLARDIRARIEALLPANLGELARRAHSLREVVARRIADGRARRRLWERLLQGAFGRAVLSGAEAEADRVLARELSAATAGPPRGRVALIGCGPGDPDLLTLKALQALQEADVLVIDRLVHPRILDYARRDAERVDVGKTPRGSATPQGEINRILVREALAGKIVARLKGGDPFIFGRAGEEMAALQAAGIPVEVIPGVTAAHACAARIGLPVTLRSRIRQFSVVTGAGADGDIDLNWQSLAAPGAAAAFYMGVRTAAVWRRKLLEAGAAPHTPVVVVENGTLSGERAIATTLHDLGACIETHGITGPAVIFLGLDWADAGLERPPSVSEFRTERRPASARAGVARLGVETAP
jgi:uroporphyrin-III C-methyltransferase/precorrin-2 dehydrogenase/sirohydrochlorin ferrochelatase